MLRKAAALPFAVVVAASATGWLYLVRPRAPRAAHRRGAPARRALPARGGAGRLVRPRLARRRVDPRSRRALHACRPADRRRRPRRRGRPLRVPPERRLDLGRPPDLDALGPRCRRHAQARVPLRGGHGDGDRGDRKPARSGAARAAHRRDRRRRRRRPQPVPRDAPGRRRRPAAVDDARRCRTARARDERAARDRAARRLTRPRAPPPTLVAGRDHTRRALDPSARPVRLHPRHARLRRARRRAARAPTRLRRPRRRGDEAPAPDPARHRRRRARHLRRGCVVAQPHRGRPAVHRRLRRARGRARAPRAWSCAGRRTSPVTSATGTRCRCSSSVSQRRPGCSPAGSRRGAIASRSSNANARSRGRSCTRGVSTRSPRSSCGATSRTSSATTSRRSSPTASSVASRSSPAIPSGPRDVGDELVARFVAYARARDWRVAILGASERWLAVYARHGLHALYHGDEAIVDTAAFSLEGRADPQGAPVGAPARQGGLHDPRPLAERDRPGAPARARGGRRRVARRPARAGLRHGARRAVRARGRGRGVRRRLRPGRDSSRLPPFRDLARGQRTLALVDAASPRHAERLQRVADLRGDRLGARARLRSASR